VFKKIFNLFKRKKKEEKKPQVTFLLRDALEKSKPRVKTLIDKYVNAFKLAASSEMTIDEALRALATASQIPLPTKEEAPQRSIQYSKHGKELEQSFEDKEEKLKLLKGKRRKIIRREERDT